ncbi:CmpA/NrtA family ABC transporter substrate-binding protein [Chthonobacter rhizosphaerae]|uniref:CmpA/NrtA family ABC transporter substrate-binding protein n=1 Tax=Chthonobacter rhizosphaerae TaxID=2735553 RepID=UPI001FE806F3|nr:CmpA/NrtA family ABC transporter substrate-binding protein [Chthonobacter rhizosphaerae]
MDDRMEETTGGLPPDEASRRDAGVIRAGFIPLVDSAALVAAARLGFAEAEGVRVDLVRQTSWASIRDRLAVGHMDVAHMLAPMPIAASLGLGTPAVPMVVPMALGLGGNAISVSTALFDAMARHGAVTGAGPAALGAALKAVVRERGPGQPLTFAMVHPFSAHNYELRYFLAAAGIHPDRDVRLVVVPPPYMVEAVESGQIDGFSVGEPWNSLAVERGAGVLLVPKVEIWRSSPCKVLGMRADWAERHPAKVAALLRAVEKAARFVDDPANRETLVGLLAAEDIVGVDPAIIRRSLSGEMVLRKGEAPRLVPDFIGFSRGAATFPWKSHALWFYSQMVRWGHAGLAPDLQATAAAVYRPDLYRAALAGAGAVMPAASAKVEGALGGPLPVGAAGGRLDLGPDRFFDGRTFDPDDVAGYLRGFGEEGAAGAG